MNAGKSIVTPRLTSPRAGWAGQPQAGQIVGERYRLVEWLERGAMGSVWRAEQVRLRSPAAIKFLEPSLIEVPEMLERFLQEARSAAAVQSAHVIQVFDYGSEEGLPYIVMEFLEGENLAARLASHGALSPVELDKVFGEIARGLGQAHALGVIHRDVKPANIFLVRQGKHEIVKLIDFGIAKVKADALQVSQVVGTQVGTLLGTPQYMSPEQMRGRNTLDHRTDLWALAIIACECLTGRYPFSGTSIGDLSVQICTEQPLAPSTLGDVPAGFDEWFFKGTSKEPSDRFESVGDMADALTKILVPGERAQALVSMSPLSALASTSAEPLRTKVTRGARSLRLPAERRFGAPTGTVGLALLGLALLVVAGGAVLLRAQRRLSPPTIPINAPALVASQPVSQEVRAVLPVAREPDGAARRTPPVLIPSGLPLLPVAEVRSKPTKASKGRRRGRRPRPPVSSDSSATSTPSSPMSAGMRRIGMLMSQGGDKRRPVRSGGADPVQASDRANSQTK
jgi:hypothetical protein